MTSMTSTSVVDDELAQIKRRYASSFEEKVQGDCRLVALSFQSSDPDFGIDLGPGGLRIQLTLPPLYPNAALTLNVLADSDAFPYDVARSIAGGVNMYASMCPPGKPMIREVLRWLDRNLEPLIRVGLEAKQLRERVSESSVNSVEPVVSTAAAPAVQQSTSMKRSRDAQTQRPPKNQRPRANAPPNSDVTDATICQSTEVSNAPSGPAQAADPVPAAAQQNPRSRRQPKVQQPKQPNSLSESVNESTSDAPITRSGTESEQQQSTKQPKPRKEKKEKREIQSSLPDATGSLDSTTSTQQKNPRRAKADRPVPNQDASFTALTEPTATAIPQIPPTPAKQNQSRKERREAAQAKKAAAVVPGNELVSAPAEPKPTQANREKKPKGKSGDARPSPQTPSDSQSAASNLAAASDGSVPLASQPGQPRSSKSQKSQPLQSMSGQKIVSQTAPIPHESGSQSNKAKQQSTSDAPKQKPVEAQKSTVTKAVPEPVSVAPAALPPAPKPKVLSKFELADQQRREQSKLAAESKQSVKFAMPQSSEVDELADRLKASTIHSMPAAQTEDESDESDDESGTDSDSDEDDDDDDRLFQKMNRSADVEASASVSSLPAAAAVSVASSAVESVDPDEWTPTQQSALEKALIMFPSSLPPAERWAMIGAHVPGRDQKACIRRFKDLREALRKQKEAGLNLVVAQPEVAPAIPEEEEMQVNVVEYVEKVEKRPKITIVPRRIRAEPTSIQEDTETLIDDERLVQFHERKFSASVSHTAADPAQSVDVSAANSTAASTHNEPLVASSIPAAKISLTNQHRGVQIKLFDVRLLGVATVRLAMFHGQVTCARCRLALEFVLQPNAPLLSVCNRCHLPYAVSLRTQLLHEHAGGTLGYLDVEQCVAYDMLPSAFVLVCLACNSELMLPSWRAAMKADNSPQQVCHSCHTQMHFSFERCEFVILQTPSLPLLPAESTRKVAVVDVIKLRVGAPLPDSGTCKHYRRSHRWLRCPVCLKAYACDECHDAEEDHPMQFASRMICGACSLEQPFSQRPCKCGQAFTSAAKVHWEGGAGCRDRKRMSSKDNKKFVGLTKTLSRRAVAKMFKK